MVVSDVFQQRIQVRKELLEMESSYKIVAYKISRKERQITRIKTAIGDSSISVSKICVEFLYFVV